MSHVVEDRGPLLKGLRVTIFLNTAVWTQRIINLLTFMKQHSFWHFPCVCSYKHKIYAVAVNDVGLGMCRSIVSGIFMIIMIETVCATLHSLIWFTLYKNNSVFMKPCTLSRGKAMVNYPRNLPRVQQARAIPDAWLGSGSCQNRPKGSILINGIHDF
jgi:hypothetical protein